MIGYLKGEVAGIYEDRIVVEVSGIGYNVFMPASSLELIEGIGQTVKVYTHLLVREDAMQLYGFLKTDDLEFYRMLLSVSGVGPKGALALLSVMSSDDLRFAILSGDAKAIGKAPGVGPKTAQRVIIDLKDKIDIEAATVGRLDDVSAMSSENTAAGSVKDEAARALVALGYSQSEAYRAVKTIGNDVEDVEEALKLALSNLM